MINEQWGLHMHENVTVRFNKSVISPIGIVEAAARGEHLHWIDHLAQVN
jgi:hypothetical protein